MDESAGPSNTDDGKPELLGALVHDGGAAAAPGHRNTVIRCICGNNADHGPMLQCRSENCGVWQHAACMAVQPGQEPPQYFCEGCRAQRADPFWESVDTSLLAPAKLRPTGKTAAAGSATQDVQAVDRAFTIPDPQYQLFKRKTSEYRLQVCECGWVGGRCRCAASWFAMCCLLHVGFRVWVRVWGFVC